MPYDPFHQSPGQVEVLGTILARAESEGSAGVAVIDLDGCLFDTRPRQVQIFRELAGQRGWEDLALIKGEHFQDWSIRNTLKNIGLSDERVEEIHDDVHAYWWKSFFTSD